MFIREVKKQRSAKAKVFYQYNLVQTSRVEGKVVQRVVLYLGSEELMADKSSRANVLDLLKSKIFNQPQLLVTPCTEAEQALAAAYYQKYLIKYSEATSSNVSIPPAPKKADFHKVDLLSLEVKDVRTYGAENLCKQVIQKLGLEEPLIQLGFTKNQAALSVVSIISRALFSSSEHKSVQYLDSSSALLDCLLYKHALNHRHLYEVADQLYQHKQQIDEGLFNKVTEFFKLENKLVIFDLSNTYFETSKRGSYLAKFGRSKEKRSDCPIVTFTGVINKEGFIQHSRIYPGDTSDSATLEDMLKDLEQHNPKTATSQTVVIDAGIATEENLQLINQKGYKYVCVSRKRLKDYTPDASKKTVTLTTKTQQQTVELAIFQPQGYTDTWMYVQSDEKRKKEESIQNKICERYLEQLQTIHNALTKKGGTKQTHKVWERIGRAKQQYKLVSGRYLIEVEDIEGVATKVTWTKKTSKEQEDKNAGVYFIRTNYDHTTEDNLWEVYNTIKEVESTFRCLKSDLNIRPIHHQKDERIQSHIYLTILAYQLINTIRYLLKEKGIKDDWKNILRIMNTQHIQTVVLPTDSKTIHLRLPSKPIAKAKEIYDATYCTHTQKATKKYVVYH